MTKTNKQKLIVVLGMHRSGTSAITCGLKVLSVELGDNLLPPVANNNEMGFWEDSDINTLNSEILSVLGSDWHYLSAIQFADIEVLRRKGYFLCAIDLMHRKIGDSPVFGFKDPRIAKLLLFWKEVFRQCQLDVSYMLAIRNPRSVVKSLATRDGFDPEKSYLLWLGHIIVTLSGTIGEMCMIIDYDRLMQSPEFELQRIAKQFDLAIDPAEMQSYKDDFLDQGLRHKVYDLNDLLLDEACPPIVQEIYSELLEVASDKKRIDDLSLQKKVAIWAIEFERIKSPLALIDRFNKLIEERDEQISAIMASWSWKLTSPLRKIKKIWQTIKVKR